MDACNAANYRYYNDWQELKPQQQAFLIAHYLVNRLIENHKNDAEMIEAERKKK